MELIYNITRKCSSNRDWKADEPALCRISCSNIIAFCSTVELECHSSKCPSIGTNYNVYVCDVDKPWQVHLVLSCKARVVALEWNTDGTQLLIASAVGKVQIWKMQKYILTNWKLLASGDLPGEEIVAITWFNIGSKHIVNGDNRDAAKPFDKVCKITSKPTASRLGNKPILGWIAVTVSGMVAVSYPMGPFKIMDVTMKSLTPGRVRLNLVDIAFTPSGDLAIVTSDGQITSAIQCYTVKVTYENEMMSLQCLAAPSFYIKCHRDSSLRDSAVARVTHVRYMRQDASDVLMVAAGDKQQSVLELWHMVSERVPLHRVYQSNVPADSTACHRQTWAFQSTIQHGSLPLSIAVPKFPILYNKTETSQQMFQYVAVAYKDGSVKLINKNTFQSMATTNLDMGWSDGGQEKRRRVIAYLSVMEQTLTGCALVGIDQLGTMYAMKVVNTRDPVTQVSRPYLLSMLEYCIVAGYDWWDVLAALRHNIVELVDHLGDHMRQELGEIREMYWPRFLSLIASLYRCAGSPNRAADTHCRLVLHSIRTHFSTILRAKAQSANEMAPMEKLSMTCQQTAEADRDKVLLALGTERMDFAVDRESLQALQPLLQWIVDVSLYLIAALPSISSSAENFAGSTLLRDVSFMSTLRELQLVTYIWGMINPTCLPHLTQPDCLQRIFSLITQLWLKAKDGSMSYDDNLLDECGVLTSHLAVPRMDQSMFGGHFSSTLIFLQNLPVKFEYGEIPGYMKSKPSLPAAIFSPDGQPPARQIRDVVRLIYLGIQEQDDVKTCSRCGCYTISEQTNNKGYGKVAAMGSWEGKWIKNCLCGGMWMETVAT